MDATQEGSVFLFKIPNSVYGSADYVDKGVIHRWTEYAKVYKWDEFKSGKIPPLMKINWL